MLEDIARIRLSLLSSKCIMICCDATNMEIGWVLMLPTYRLATTMTSVYKDDFKNLKI